ncbi:hypothetical protein Ae201684P_011105 [Aphanomyces euteiches]|nr:hypothetical protein Ae201684P_011105 [Aphanomyces euteiches]
MAPSQVVVAVVGAGRMGQIRLTGFHSNPKTKIAYVVDENLQQAQLLAAQFDARGVQKLSEALKDPALCGYQHRRSRTASLFIKLQRRVKLSLLRSQLQVHSKSWMQLCEEGHVPLFCSFQRRFDPHYVALRDAVVAKEIGIVQSIQTVFRDHPCPPIEFLKTGGDPFHDLAVHDIDFVCDLLQEYPTQVFAYGTSLQPELAAVMDKASVWLTFPSGVVCTMDLARHASYGYDQRIEVFGRDGMLEVQNVNKTAVRASTAGGIHQSPFLHSFPQRFRDAYALEIEHFATVVLDKVPPKVTWRASRNATIIAEACHQSAIKRELVQVLWW